MKFWLLGALFGLIAALSVEGRATSFNPTPQEASVDDPPPVATSQNGNWEGFWTKSRSGRPIAAFEGIRYARPIEPKLRLKIARPPLKDDKFMAKQPGPACVQRQGPYTEEVSGKEDCLFINIYIPEKVGRPEHERLPVIFFVHGGSFFSGQGADFKPTYFLDKDVVFVTFNYRLGSLGFLTTDDDVIPRNIGLRDQDKALEYVNDNIDGFGGDPNRITVMGHSAGGASSEYLMLSHLSKDNLHRVIALSGSSFSPCALYPEGQPADIRNKFADHLKCPPTPSEDLANCIRNKTVEEILSAESNFKTTGGVPVFPFRPVIGGSGPAIMLPSPPRKMYEEGNFNDVPFLTGITTGEGAYVASDIFNNDGFLASLNANFSEVLPELLCRPKLTKEQVETIRKFYFGSLEPLNKTNLANAIDLVTDNHFMWPMLQSERYRKAKAKSPTYFYYFGYERGQNSSSRDEDSVTGYSVSHGGELPYLFPLGDLSSGDLLLSNALIELFTSFARDGAPSASALNIKWDPVTSNGTDVEYLHFNNIKDIKMEKNLLPERWGFWDKLDNPQ